MAHKIRIQRPETDVTWIASWGKSNDARDELSKVFWADLEDYSRKVVEPFRKANASYTSKGDMGDAFYKLHQVVYKDYPYSGSQHLTRIPIAGQHVDLTTDYEVDSEERADKRHATIVDRLQPFIDRARELGMTIDTGVAIFIDENTCHQSRMENARDDNLLLAEALQFQKRKDYEEQLKIAARTNHPFLADFLENYEMMRDRHLITLAEMDERRLSPAREQAAQETLAHLNERELKSRAAETRSLIKADRLPGALPSAESDMAQRHLGFIATAQEVLQNPLPATVELPRFSRLLPAGFTTLG